MLSDYRIEKDRLPVVVVTTAGERLPGDVFVQAYARHRTGREEPWDILNAPELFFPLGLNNGDTLLVAKAHVRELEIVGEARNAGEAVPAHPSTIELSMTGGIIRAGRVYLEVPYDHPRLLDFLNRFGRRFLSLYTDDGVRLVNVGAIERVRQLD